MERSEIRVTIGGEECTDRGSAGGDIVSSLCYSELYIITFASSLSVRVRSSWPASKWQHRGSSCGETEEEGIMCYSMAT